MSADLLPNLLWTDTVEVEPSKRILIIREHSDSDKDRMVEAPAISAPDWRARLKKQLDILSVLKSDWDPGGAAPPNPLCMARARGFSHLLYEANLQPDNARPSVEEGIAFNFHTPSKYAAIEFLNDGSIGLILSEEHKTPEIEDLSGESELRAALEQLTRFLR